VSVALIDLREHRARGITAIDAVLDASHAYFQRCLASRTSLVPPASLLTVIDTAMAEVAATHDDAAAALLRYRLALMALPPVTHPESPSTQPTLSILSQ
jgi:hypothetical protein